MIRVSLVASVDAVEVALGCSLAANGFGEVGESELLVALCLAELCLFLIAHLFNELLDISIGLVRRQQMVVLSLVLFLLDRV